MNQKNKTVGEEVYKRLESGEASPQVQEIIDEYQKQYVDEMHKAIEINAPNFEDPFYIVVLHKKEPWALNVLRNYFIGRQTRPSVKTMWKDYKNYMHTVYECDSKKGELKLLYTLPSPFEAKNIIKNWMQYDAQLVRWCHNAFLEMDGKSPFKD